MTTAGVPILRPGDAGYDEARLGFDRRVALRPALVIEAEDPADVAAAVRLAADEGRRVTVQATGHGPMTTDPDAVLVSTRRLQELSVDPGTRVARLGAGVTAGTLVAAAAEHGLAPLNGSHPGVGVAGYTLHGGLPLLGRAHGWAADRLHAVELVTATGDARRVELGAADGDLAWALRGGGGSFGIVTALELELIELETVYGGMLAFDAEHAGAVLRAWRDWARDAPDALGTGAGILPVPDVEGPPPPLRGRTVVTIHVAFDGPAADGERLLAPIRALAQPLLDGVCEMPWTASAGIHAEPPGPTSSAVTNVALHDLPDAAVDAALEGILGAGAPRALALRRLGGALARPGVSGPVRRDAGWLAGVVAIVPPPAVPDGIPAAEAFTHEWRARMAPHAAGTLAGFLAGDGADPAAVASAYRPDDWARLRAIRAAEDPDGRILAGAPIPD